jgi:methionyl-tRNA synthetase
MLDLRVGKVVSIEDHPDAEKLFIMSVDLGDEKRQIVAGLKGYYTSEELDGRDLVILCNLQPAKLRGVESNGMLLAAEHKEIVSVVLAEGSAPGTQVFGSKGLPVMSFEDFKKMRIVVSEVEEGRKTVAVLDGKREILLKAGGEPVTLHRDVPAGSQVK